MNQYQTLYPTLGEVLNAAAEILDTKPPYTDDSDHPDYRVARQIDGLGGSGTFNLDYMKITPCIDRIFRAPFAEEGSDFAHYLKNVGHGNMANYISMIRQMPLSGFSRKQTIPWLVERYACLTLYQMIATGQESYRSKLSTLDLFKDKYPLRSTFVWLETTYPAFAEFARSFGENDWIGIKNERDKIWKWTHGVDIPKQESLWGTSGLLDKFYIAHAIGAGDRQIINETVFFAKILQSFYRKTSGLNTFENIRDMATHRYMGQQPDTSLLKSRLTQPEAQIMKALSPLFEIIWKIQEVLNTCRPMTAGYGKGLLELIEQAEQELQSKAEYHPNWWDVRRYRGIWHTYEGDIESAILCYRDAVDGMLYSGSETTPKALREILSVCGIAYLRGLKKVGGANLRSLMKRLKGQGCVFGYYPLRELYFGEELSNEEIGVLAGYFNQYFPGAAKKLPQRTYKERPARQ